MTDTLQLLNQIEKTSSHGSININLVLLMGYLNMFLIYLISNRVSLVKDFRPLKLVVKWIP